MMRMGDFRKILPSHFPAPSCSSLVASSLFALMAAAATPLAPPIRLPYLLPLMLRLLCPPFSMPVKAHRFSEARRGARGGKVDFKRSLDTPEGAEVASLWMLRSGPLGEISLASALLRKYELSGLTSGRDLALLVETNSQDSLRFRTWYQSHHLPPTPESRKTFKTCNGPTRAPMSISCDWFRAATLGDNGNTCRGWGGAPLLISRRKQFLARQLFFFWLIPDLCVLAQDYRSCSMQLVSLSRPPVKTLTAKLKLPE